MTTLIFFFASVFRDWRQRHVAPPQWPGLWVHIPDTAHWALSWPWVMAPTLGAHCAVINTDPAPGTGSCPSGKTSQHIYIYYGEIEIAFLISPSGKCLWSLQLSWLNLLLRIFAGISKLHRRRNLLVSWLHWITAMVKCWLHRGSSHGCCCNVKLAASHQMLPIVPLSCQIKL